MPEIQEITRKYIDGAERAQKAGYDGIDINAGSSHIIHNFLSPFWNRRTDEYGGTQVKRAKLLLDILTGIKERCGADFPIVVCLNGFEDGYAIGADHTFTHNQAVMTMLLAEEAGADAIMIRSSWLGIHVAGFLPDYLFYPDAQVPLDRMPPQYYAKERGRGAIRLMTEEAKKLVSVPVILVGYVTPDDGEKLLGKGAADFIGMNRPLMCDPDLPKKLAEGRPEDVAPCTRCGTCLDQSEQFLRHCRLNAALGLRLPERAGARGPAQEGRRGRRRPGRHGGRPRRRPARPRRDARRDGVAARRPAAAGDAHQGQRPRGPAQPDPLPQGAGQEERRQGPAEHRGHGRVDRGDERRRRDPRDRRRS